LKTFITIIFTLTLMVISGCGDVTERQVSSLEEIPQDSGVLLTVDFEEGKPLRYKFVSYRSISVDWGPAKEGSKKSRNIKRSSERAEMVFSYRPVKVETYGTTSVEVRCESVSVSREGQRTMSREALRSLKGKTYTLEIDSRGAILDYSSLQKVAQEIAEKAFRQSSKGGRIKDPDMVRDFVATQWFLWDSISSIKNPAQGVTEGQSWQSQLYVPLPMLVKAAREVTYSLEEIQENEKGRLAVIKSKYSLGEPVDDDWPWPYKGSFVMSGQFGFLSGYNLLSLNGRGEQLFDIDKGRIKTDRQNYFVEMDTSFPIPLGDGERINPKIRIRQSITMESL
jgi:hypothetical protein